MVLVCILLETTTSNMVRIPLVNMNERNPRIIQLQKVAGGANIHTANKCMFYYDGWKDREKTLEPAIDAALAGDWKPLQNLLRGLW